MDTNENLLNDLYKKISPAGFEKLSELLLEKMGFDEIERTGGSGDYGIDLKAILRKSEIENIETNTPFCIQAKRYDPEKLVNPSVIRELRGSLISGQRGLLITTARVSDHSIENEALRDISRVVLVIDGRRLIELLKKYQLGVVSKYVVDDTLIGSLESKEEIESTDTPLVSSKKLVTENDIRAKIIRIPSEIKTKLAPNQTSIPIFIDGHLENFNIDQTKTFISGVTDLFRKNQLIDENGNSFPKQAIWHFEEGKFSLSFEESNEEIKSAEIFKAAMEKNFPLAKRIKNTSVYEINGVRTLIRYSKVYSDGVHYWFGLHDADLDRFSSGEVDYLYLLCVGKGFLIFDKSFILAMKDRLNTSIKESGNQYHIHIEYFNDERILLIIRNGERISIGKSVRIIPYQNSENTAT